MFSEIIPVTLKVKNRKSKRASPSSSIFHTSVVYTLSEVKVLFCFFFCKDSVTDSFPASKSTCKGFRLAELSKSLSGTTELH